MQPHAPNTVLIVDDLQVMRNGIRSLLGDHKDLNVVGEAQNGFEAVQYARVLKPHVILMDINMPALNGIHATQFIREEDPDTVIIGLSTFVSGQESQATLRAGASAYLNKESLVEDLYPTIMHCLRARTECL
jgi:two-component system NarL family response regulator